MSNERLLIFTQKVDRNDSVLGFFHRWVEELARHFAEVHVVCLYEGVHNLPKNCSVYSLGKEKGTPRIWMFVRFYRMLWELRSVFDSVFVHMNTEYVLLGGPLWRAFGKRIVLWYAHGHVSWRLRLAERLVHAVVTSTPSGFRIKSPKVHAVGQGIDTLAFHPVISPPNEQPHIISVGRISPVKDYKLLMDAVWKLKHEYGIHPTVSIVGEPGTSDQHRYLDDLVAYTIARDLGNTIYFKGAVTNYDLPPVLQGADLFVNTSRTGSLDKAVLEAMATGLPVLTCNEAFRGVLGEFADDLMFAPGDADACARKISWIVSLSEQRRRELGEELRAIILRDHTVEKLATSIAEVIKTSYA
jgi:glycosyltransferase involved in cell wall biosynthesis